MTFFLYVFRSFIKNTLSVTAVCLFIYVLFDYIQRNPRYFSKYDASISDIFRYYVFQTPSILVELLPIAVMLASVITTIILVRSNELTAMRAAGGSVSRVATPLLFGGFLVSSGLFFTIEYILPFSTKHFNITTRDKIEKKSDQEYNFRKTWLRAEEKIYNYQRYDVREQAIYDLRIDILSDSFRPVQTLRAAKAVYDPKSNPEWRLENTHIFDFNSDDKLISMRSVKEMKYNLPVKVEDLKSDRFTAEQFSITELYNKVREEKKRGISFKDIEIEFHQKISILLLIIIVALVGLRFSYFFERNTDVVFGVIVAVFIGMSYWLVLGATRAMSTNGIIEPVLAMWIPNVVLLFTIGLDLRFARKRL